ncbi:MAG: SBBP repeat-containing protein, partial [Verrucomicrobia bacterium]|nr:SBBP repeat-containing protein [Verrucomicrobiota bacterium]
LTTGDVLAVTTLDGISGTYNAGTGVLTLTGTKTLAQYQAAFRRVTYRSTSEDPTAIAGSRTVSWAVTDANSDLAGAQTSVAVTSTINITPSNDKPVVTAGATLAYAENAAATAIDGTMTVNDADDTEITGATATISAGLTTGDLLAVATQNGISGSYSAGVLTLTGTATLANYQTALRSVTYHSTSEDPTATFASRTVTWAVTDANSDLAGAQTSVAVTSTITITPSNDKPVVTAGATLAYTENAAATAIDGTVTVNDADDTQITGATATISAGLTAGDLLAVTTQNGISGTYNAGVLTLTGTTTLANYQAALRSVTYHSTSDYPTQTSNSRTIGWRVTDANSDLAGAETSVVVTSTISITEVNDAPVNTYPATIALYENASFSFTGLNTLSVADAELNMASAQLTAAGGTLLVNLAGGATISAGTNGRSSMTISGTQAQINAALATLTYSGIQHYSGLDTLTIVSRDADSNPLTDTDSIAITVYAVNSAPAGGDGAISVPMNGSYALKAADFGFNDSNDSPANLLTRVLVTSLPGSSKGTLTLNGVAVAAGSYVTVADINAGLLVYTPPADENGFAYTSFTFQVEDDGGTANGGLNLDASANLMTIHVGGIVPQTLCFVAPPEAPQSQALPLYGNATSGLNVVYSVVSGPGTLVGNLLTFTGSGPVVVRASQPGDLTYRPAPAVDQTINSVSLSIPISVSDGWNVQHGAGASSQANAIAIKLSGQAAQFVAVTGYVTGAGGKRDLYVTKRNATTGTEVWGKTHAGAGGLDDEGSAVAYDSAGNIVVAGHETNAAGNTDVVVFKYAAADGSLLWSKKFVGTDGVTDKGADALGSYDTPNRVIKGRKNLAVGPSDEVIVGGYVTNASGGRDLLVVKYHSDGTKAWHQTYDGAAGTDYANAVAVDATGVVYAAGGSRSASTLDGVTLKYAASDGALVWQARYDNGKPDEVTSLMLDRDGNPVVSGYTQEETYNMFVLRYNKDVDPMSALATTILWESKFDNPAYQSSEAVWDMGLVFGKDVMLAGTSYPTNGLFNAYTMRFKGTCVNGARWDREYNGAARGQDQMVAMGADYFGSPVVVGYSQVAGGKYAIQTMKYDAEPGSLLWSKTYESADGNSEPRAVAVDPSGNVFVAGYTTVAGGVTKVLVQSYTPYSNPTRAAQTISFTNPGAQLAGKTITLAGTASSGLQVEYTVISGPATVTGNSLVLSGDGNVTLKASQPGSGDYQPATPVVVAFSVSRASQTISFNLPAKMHKVNGQWEYFPLAGVCSSGLPLTYEVLSGPATITAGVLQLSAAGPVTVRASQIGDSSYDPAVSVDRTVTGEVLGSFTILDGFHVNWTDRSLLDVTDSSSFAEGEAVAVALGLTGNDATAGYVAGFVRGATGKDLYLTKYTHNIITGTAVQSWVRRKNGSANGDDEAAAVAVDASGNVIVAGYVTTTTGRDVYVAKYDSNGGNGTPGSSTPIWEYTYNGTSNGTDMALSLALQGTSHVIVGGRAAGTGTGDDFFAAKLNSSDGTAVWAKQNNRTSTLSDIPAKVVVGSDGTVVLAGISGSGNSANAWTVKLDSGSGSLLWQRVYNFANKPDAMRGLALDGANNVIVSGYSQSANYDMYTAKYEAGTGSIIWEKRYNGSFNSSDSAFDVIVDRQGYVLVTGTSYRAASVKDGMTLKYNGLDGTLAWAKRPFNNLGTTSANDENFSIAVDGLGNLVLVGYTSRAATGIDYYVARHLNNGGVTDGNTAGEAVFDGYYAGNDNIYQVRMDPNGAIWMVGYTATGSGVRQPLVVRLAPGP